MRSVSSSGRRITLALLCGTVLVAAEAPLPLPSAVEVHGLHLVNRYRADPQAWTEWLLRPARLGLPGQVLAIDWQQVRAELAELRPAPPLVVDRRLLAAARGHASYLHRNRATGHGQLPGRPGFTGVDLRARVQQVGYRSMGTGENAFTNSRGAVNALRGYLIDWGPDPAGLLPGRGHRLGLMRSQFCEIGLALVPHGDGFAASVQVFGMGLPRRRPVGGLIWRDGDGDGVFDPGEGLGEVTVDCGGQETRSWPSGGFALTTGLEAGELLLRIDAQERRLPLPAGRQAVYLEWRVPRPEDGEGEQAMLARLATAQSDTERLDCWWSARRLALSDAAADRLEAATAEVVERFEQARARVRQAVFWEGPRAGRQAAATAAADFPDSEAAAWFAASADLAELWWEGVDFMDRVRARQSVRAGSKRSLIRRATTWAHQTGFADLREAAEHMALLLDTLGRRP